MISGAAVICVFPRSTISTDNDNTIAAMIDSAIF
jgi:hypothetical protein